MGRRSQREGCTLSVSPTDLVYGEEVNSWKLPRDLDVVGRSGDYNGVPGTLHRERIVKVDIQESVG